MVTIGKLLIDQILWILENMDVIELYFIKLKDCMKFLMSSFISETQNVRHCSFSAVDPASYFT